MPAVLLQDILVTALIEALAAAMQHVADLFDTNSDNQAALKEEPTAYHCCCISMVLCINRRLLWLKEERTPQHERVLQLLDDSIQQVTFACAQKLTCLQARVLACKQ